MAEDNLFNFILIAFSCIAVGIFILLFFYTAPYGQHTDNKKFSSKFGRFFTKIRINDRIGWIIMEIPTVLIYLILYSIGSRTGQIMPVIFLIIWMVHYGQRTFVFPLLIRGKHEMPLSIILMGMIFNSINSYLQARWLNTLSNPFTVNWLLTPQFIIGILIFGSGYFINLQSDHIIRNLRGENDDEFHIPSGGMFKLVSCPSYLGEIMEWVGWSVLTWSYPGLIFAIWTFANLAPRARSTHKWYIEKFPDYPKNRKALIPFLF